MISAANDIILMKVGGLRAPNKIISCVNRAAAISPFHALHHSCTRVTGKFRLQFQGLFSRITFREPLFVGGPGNTTGLERLPVRTGFKGCIRHLEANEHHYRFPLAPQGDAANGFDVGKYTASRGV